MTLWNLEQAAHHYLVDKWTYQQIADKYNCHPSTAYQMLARHPEIRALRKQRKDNRLARKAKTGQTRTRKHATDEQMLMWQQGATLRQLCEGTKNRPPTMRQWIINHPRYEEFKALRTKPPYGGNHQTKVNREEVGRLYKEGGSIYSIAEQFDVSHQRIQQIVSKYFTEEYNRRRAEAKARVDANKLAKEIEALEREALEAEYQEAIQLYLDGFAIRELRPLFKNINWHTFGLRLNKMRKKDPSLPSERGKTQGEYNWQKRTIAAVKSTKTYVEAAALVGIQYGVFMNRINILRRKGIDI